MAVALATVLAPGRASTASPIVVGRHPLLDQPAPEIALESLDDGSTVRLAEFRGRPVLVNFWASWCIPCREEFPLLRSALADPANRDLVVLGVVYNDDPDSARRFMAAQQATWAALLDPDRAAANAYRVFTPPVTFYVNRAGIVRAVSFGPPPRDVFAQYLARIR